MIEWNYQERQLRSRPFGLATVAVLFVPGLALSLIPGLRLLPAGIVHSLYPYCVFPWDRAFVAMLAALPHSGGAASVDLSDPGARIEQLVVVALLASLTLLLIVGLQTWANALFMDQRARNFPTMLAALPTMLFLRCIALNTLMSSGTTNSNTLLGPLLSHSGRILAPAAVIGFTCLFVMALYALARISYLCCLGRLPS